MHNNVIASFHNEFAVCNRFKKQRSEEHEQFRRNVISKMLRGTN